MRERFFTPRLRVKSYDELNAWLMDKCIARAKAHAHPELSERTIGRCSRKSGRKLIPYRGRFDGFHALLGLGVEDPPGPVRQQQILGQRQRRWSAGRHPRLCRSHCDPPGRADCWRTSSQLWPRRRRFMIPGNTCRFWRASRALCATARRSRIGCCRRRWTACGESWPGPDDGDRQMRNILAAVLTDGLAAVDAACLQALSEGVQFRRRRHQHPCASARSGTSGDNHDARRFAAPPRKSIADCARYAINSRSA